MGGYLSGPIKEVLVKYTYNFEDNQLNFELLKGNIKIENLVINESEINKKLEQSKLPYKLKFGILKKFELKLSIIGARLDSLKVEDLILIIGPNERESEKFSEQENREMVLMGIQNIIFQNTREGPEKYLDPNVWLRNEKNSLNNPQSKLVPTRTPNSEKSEEDGFNFLGIELVEIIKNFLDCNITIENVNIIFEDSYQFISNDNHSDNFQALIQLKKLCFRSQDIIKSTDKNGIFKGMAYPSLVWWNKIEIYFFRDQGKPLPLAVLKSNSF